jgi:signal peptidase I
LSVRKAEPGSVRELVELFLLSLAVAVLLVTFIAQPFVVDGTSMEPSLVDGERLIVSKLSYHLGQPARGDVVVFRFPGDRHQRFIKRVVGLPGETVSIRDGKVLVDGRPLAEAYLADATFGEYGPVRVPRGRLFLLGDNRANSRDSRYPEVGLVAYADLVGKAVAAYWPPLLAGAVRGSGRGWR